MLGVAGHGGDEDSTAQVVTDTHNRRHRDTGRLPPLCHLHRKQRTLSHACHLPHNTLSHTCHFSQNTLSHTCHFQQKTQNTVKHLTHFTQKQYTQSRTTQPHLHRTTVNNNLINIDIYIQLQQQTSKLSGHKLSNRSTINGYITHCPNMSITVRQYMWSNLITWNTLQNISTCATQCVICHSQPDTVSGCHCHQGDDLRFNSVLFQQEQCASHVQHHTLRLPSLPVTGGLGHQRPQYFGRHKVQHSFWTPCLKATLLSGRGSPKSIRLFSTGCPKSVMFVDRMPQVCHVCGLDAQSTLFLGRMTKVHHSCFHTGWPNFTLLSQQGDQISPNISDKLSKEHMLPGQDGHDTTHLEQKDQWTFLTF